MVIVSPADIIVQEGKDTMNTTCALGPRHNLFGGGIVSTIDSWHQIQNCEATSIKQESSPRSQDSEGSPYSSGNELHSGYYASYEEAGLSSKEESNNNNSNQTLVPSENNDTADDGKSPNVEGEHGNEDGDALLRLQLALQRAAGDRQLQCPYCAFVTTSRASLELHLQQSHEDQRTCGLCEFTAESNEKLVEHVRESHSTHAPSNTSDNDVRDDDDEQGLAVPKINSQGKVKTFRCKQCDFSAVTKLEFWEHTRSHIKQERLLTCPRCPFVTEYKHHLEYHLRNHFGSKPFKCDKCSYSCVNKSMLNSHLKSHSNVYQFSCADCNYATKYCHSLKLHLRKYDHKPAMVLNPDGSPNPLPIIDVYGTRRGPKMKHSRATLNSEEPSQPRTSPPHLSSSISLPEHPQQLQQQQQQANLIHPLFASAYGLPYYNPLLHPLMYQAGKALSHENTMSSPVTMVDQHDKANYYFNNNNNVNNNNRNNNGDVKDDESNHRFSPNLQVNEIVTDQRPLEDAARAPLDLSRWDASASQEEHSQSPPPRIVTERRRKGKAYRLDTLRQERTSEDDDEMRDVLEPSAKRRHLEDPEDEAGDEGELPLKCVLVEEESSSSSPEANRGKKSQVTDSPKESYNCNYCDITFRDVVMYTMHMGYHGYGDPYTCNMCGETTTDRVTFFLHIARTPHS